MKPKEKELMEGIQRCEEMIKELEINSTTTQIQIIEYFQKMRNLLDEKEKKLLQELEAAEKAKKKKLQLQKEELEFGIQSISGSCKMIESSLSLSNESDINLLAMKNQYTTRLNYLLNQEWKISPCEDPKIECSMLDQDPTDIKMFDAKIFNPNDILAEECLIVRNDRQRIFEDEEYSFDIVTYSMEGKKLEFGGSCDRFSINILGVSSNPATIEWNINDLENGSYQVKLKIKERGNYSVSIQFDGIEISTSPFQIEIFSKQKNYSEIRSPRLTFGEGGNGDAQFQSPFDVRASSMGLILVSDFGNHRIQVFDSNGHFISTFGSNGSGSGQFKSPFGLAINSKGHIIVSDQENHRIQIFDAGGNFLSTFGSMGKKSGQFCYPRGIAVSSYDNIYVCDYFNNRIQIFNSKGIFISEFGSKGYDNGQFDGPWAIAINSKGNLIVVDFTNQRIQMFTAQGQFLSTFGSYGSGPGQFHVALGVAVDLNDNILISDHVNNRIQIFNPNGGFIQQIKVDLPGSISIDPITQHILVSSNKNNKIQVY